MEILTVAIGSTILFEIAGPTLTQIALQRAGNLPESRELDQASGPEL
jgi:hypothetical protein